MPSVKNPNGPSKNRFAARASHAKRQRQKLSEAGKDKIAHRETRRGARPGLMPTSGPNKPISKKKAKKLEKKMGYALRRKMELEGEVVMKDLLEEAELQQKSGEADAAAPEEEMEIA
ncbi:hypothetical protein N3K66_007983 [Trichothecium roseum]|uniref:Uncharacterized protein n=1 Tax=Trichothecium roseum TaxID=47278 RepID=A0ACC0US99_9HYPO|nr:hypothetical protein N3K66_007983 [Trichothecium roseum]